jgi:hypothetical protein
MSRNGQSAYGAGHVIARDEVDEIIRLARRVPESVWVPSVEFLPPDSSNRSDVDELCERIVRAHRAARRSFGSSAQRSKNSASAWDGDGWCGRQASLAKALDDGCVPAVKRLLCEMFCGESGYGVAMGGEDLARVRACRRNEATHSLQWLDGLVTLGAELGALEVANPELGRADEFPRSCSEIDLLAGRIEHAAGVPLSFPQVAGAYGPLIRSEVFPRIAQFHYLAAVYVRRLSWNRNHHVVELGGGFGGLAYYYCQHACGRYTIYDLPFALAMQAYFLALALPSLPLRLFDEPRHCGAIYAELLPAEILATEPTDDELQPDVLINQDCVAELDPLVARLYLTRLRPRIDGLFISIGPDRSGASEELGGCRVADAVERAGGFRLIDRTSFAIRPGYYREIFRTI